VAINSPSSSRRVWSHHPAIDSTEVIGVTCRPLWFFIDAGFVEGLRLADGQGSGLSVEFLEEATQVAGVAGAAGLLDLKEEHIAVAIRKPATDCLRVTTGPTLEPEFFS